MKGFSLKVVVSVAALFIRGAVTSMGDDVAASSATNSPTAAPSIPAPVESLDLKPV